MNEQILFEHITSHILSNVGHEFDPGAMAKYGLRQSEFPNENVEDLTLGEAVELYRVKLWEGKRIRELPRAWAFLVMDTAVTHSVDEAIQWLRATAGLPASSEIDQDTVSRARTQMNTQYSLATYCAKRGGSPSDFIVYARAEKLV